MKKNKLLLLFVVAALVLSFSTAAIFAQAPQKAPKKVFNYPPTEHFGFVPPPHDPGWCYADGYTLPLEEPDQVFSPGRIGLECGGKITHR